LNSPVSGADYLYLKNCVITLLQFGPQHLPHVVIENCRIQKLQFGYGVQHLEICNSEIQEIAFDNKRENFIHGPVRLRKVCLPTSSDQLQHLRILGADLRRIHNSVAAGLIHAAALRIERWRQGWTDFLLSYLYDFASAYGTSTVRPLLWFAFLVVCNIAFLTYVDGTKLGGRELVGWQTVLLNDQYASFYRALTLTFGQVINPFGIFNAAPLVVATKSWVAAISAFLCAFAMISFALFALAVRRGFKLDP
jgi:hypothetical protein